MIRDDTNERPMFLLGPIAAILRWLEELANLLSGPLLAGGAIIAVIDLTTDGRLTATYPPILYLFAISQAVGVDVQLTGAWDRARHALVLRRWWGLLGQILLGLLLGGIVYVGLYAFLGEQSFRMTTTQALTALGVSAPFWLFLRAGIAIFLVALSAWTRYRAPRQRDPQATAAEERARLERELELEPLRARLRHTRLAGVRDVATALVGRLPVTPAVDVSDDEEAASLDADDTTDVQPLDEPLAASERTDEPPVDEPPVPPDPPAPVPFRKRRTRQAASGRKPTSLRMLADRSRTQTQEAQAFALLDEHPRMSIANLRAILARSGGCSQARAAELKHAWLVARITDAQQG